MEPARLVWGTGCVYTEDADGRYTVYQDMKLAVQSRVIRCLGQMPFARVLASLCHHLNVHVGLSFCICTLCCELTGLANYEEVSETTTHDENPKINMSRRRQYLCLCHRICRREKRVGSCSPCRQGICPYLRSLFREDARQINPRLRAATTQLIPLYKPIARPIRWNRRKPQD